MGGFTAPPPEPAPEYPPANDFDIASFTETVVQVLQKHHVPGADALATAQSLADAFARILAMGVNVSGDVLAAVFASLLEIWRPVLEALVKAAVVVMEPGMEVLGGLTSVYAQQFTKGQEQIKAGSPDSPRPTLQPVAAGMFDSILAPVAHLTTGANPAQVGAGEVNSKYILGSIISLHLSTWMVNIISNLTGLGALKFINSFDDVILAALSTRSLSRAAFKGYITKFVGDPLERDLNLKLPLDSFGPSTLVKTFLRGGLTRDQLVQKMRGKGYAENITEQLLLDTAKMLPLDAVAYLVNNEAWTERQGLEHLEQQGYPNELAPTVLYLSRNDLIFSQYRSLANSLVAARGDRQFSNELLREMLADLGFTQNEVNAFALRGAMLAELPKRLSLAQVKELYKESLVDLNYVHLFLKDEGYSEDDTDLLELLEFTKKDERDARIRAQAEAKRHREEAAAEAESAREATRQAALLRLAV